SYSHLVTLTSDDPRLTPPLGTVNVNGGVGVLTGLVLETAGTRAIFASDGTLMGETTLNVSPGDAFQLAVTAPTEEQAGTPFFVTITAQDRFGNTVTHFAQTVRLTSTDPKATGMDDIVLENGSAFIVTTHETAGEQTITATSRTNPAISGERTVL